MPVVAENLTMGPGALYGKPFNAATPIADEPAKTNIANNTAPPVAFVDYGGTTDGITISLNQEYAELTADQVVDRIGRRLTSRDITLATNLAEPTLANLAKINNELAANVVAGAGTDAIEYSPTFGGTTASQPNYQSLIMDGWGAGYVGTTGQQLRRRVIVRKALSIENVEFAYSKEDQTVFSVSFAGHYVSGSVAPYVIRDSKTDLIA